MAGIVPTTLDAMPAQESHNVARPLFGRTVSTLTNGINYMAGFRGLRFTHQQCIISGGGNYDVPPVGPMNNEPTIRWVVSPVAQYVWWAAWIASDEYGSSPSVMVYLETAAGVLIDGPIEWTTDNGRLPVTYYTTPGVAASQYGAAAGRDKLIHTGWSDTSTNTAPRLLDVSAHQGQAVQIRVVPNDTRIYSHMALEAYRGGI